LADMSVCLQEVFW